MPWDPAALEEFSPSFLAPEVFLSAMDQHSSGAPSPFVGYLGWLRFTA